MGTHHNLNIHLKSCLETHLPKDSDYEGQLVSVFWCLHLGKVGMVHFSSGEWGDKLESLRLIECTEVPKHYLSMYPLSKGSNVDCFQLGVFPFHQWSLFPHRQGPLKSVLRSLEFANYLFSDSFLLRCLHISAAWSILWEGRISGCSSSVNTAHGLILCPRVLWINPCWVLQSSFVLWWFTSFIVMDRSYHKIDLKNTLFFSISLALRFIRSFVSLILLCITNLCNLSSWLSISQYCFTWATVTLSLCPREITSSKAKISSKAALQTPSSSKDGEYSGTYEKREISLRITPKPQKNQ